jgi:uncharacterized membrane protein YphA (DoxX/SURF4 family)
LHQENYVFETIFKEKLGPLTLRLALGLTCVYHGYLKVAANGGTSWTSGMSTTWQMVLAWGELVAGLAILLGFYCRTASFGMLAISIGTLIWWQSWHIFRMPVRNLEPFVLLWLTGASLLFTGPGEISLDARSGGSRGSSSGAAAPKKKAA